MSRASGIPSCGGGSMYNWIGERGRPQMCLVKANGGGTLRITRSSPRRFPTFHQRSRPPYAFHQVWGTGSWWCKPEWNRRKRYASVRDLCRLF
jgi:hypothetical protein